MRFQKGKPKTGGRTKGAKNKLSVILEEYKGFSSFDKQRVYLAAMQLVDKGNVTMISRLVDKLIPNAVPESFNDSDKEIIVNIDVLSDEKINEMYDEMLQKQTEPFHSKIIHAGEKEKC